MKRTKIEDILKKRFLGINFSLGKVIKKFKSRDIRLFRIEVKKLHTFVRLMKTGGDVKELELPKKLHKFYNEVGIIRTFRLQQKQIRRTALKIKPDVCRKAYLNLLTDKIEHSVRYARSIVKGKNPFEKGEQKLEKQVPRKLGIAKMREFTWAEATSLKNLLRSALASDEALHSIRKLFKDILYAWPYIGKEARAILPSAIFCSREDLDFIARRLGKFQDACISLVLLREEISDPEGDKKEQLFLKTLEEAWLMEKDALRSEIHNLFQNSVPTHQRFTFIADGDHVEIENKLLTR